MVEEWSPSPVSRLHDYLRGQASGRADVTLVPPFTLFGPQGEARGSASYAVPDAPLGGDVHAALVRLGAAFAARGCRTRITFLAEFAPDLLPALQAAGFAEETRTELLTCTPTTLRPAAVVPGLTIVTLDATSPLDEVREGLDANERGFDPRAAPTTDAAADAFRQGLVRHRCVSYDVCGTNGFRARRRPGLPEHNEC